MSLPVVKGASANAVLQDLKSNRRLQVALVALAGMIWYLWPTAAPVSAKGAPGRKAASASLGDRQSRELQKLPDLAKLNMAGELPSEDRMLRDLFLFEGPTPPVIVPKPKPIPLPPELTPEEKAKREAARILAEDRAREASSKPTNMRYLGYLANHHGRLAAFEKGEEPVSCRQGDLFTPQWRLVKVTDVAAEFQNVKYPDLKHRIDAIDPKSTAGATQANEY